jgi:hypothetical protein
MFLSFNRSKPEPDKIIVLIDQVPWERPIANTIETFWLDKEHFDTIQITGKALVTEVNQTLKNLSPDKNYSKISYESCIIRFSKGQAIDTFYSWRWFDYWKKGSTMYFDSTKRLKELLMKSHNVQWTK